MYDKTHYNKKKEKEKPACSQVLKVVRQMMATLITVSMILDSFELSRS